MPSRDLDPVTRLTADAVGEPGEWRMVRTSANGQPATVSYRHGAWFCVAVLTVGAGFALLKSNGYGAALASGVWSLAVPSHVVADATDLPVPDAESVKRAKQILCRDAGDGK